jgi:hypothetical protein
LLALITFDPVKDESVGILITPLKVNVLLLESAVNRAFHFIPSINGPIGGFKVMLLVIAIFLYNPAVTFGVKVVAKVNVLGVPNGLVDEILHTVLVAVDAACQFALLELTVV